MVKEKETKETKEMSNELIIPKDEKALQELLKPAPGTEEISSEDIVMPRIRLLQDLSAEVKAKDAQSGKLKHNLTGEIYDSLEFIPITMHKSRLMFDTDNRQGAPLCRSNDTKIGSDGMKCAECDNAKWKDNKPPVCNMIFNYLIIQPKEVGNAFLPSILSFMKTSAQAALKLNMSVGTTIPRQPFWNKIWKVVPKIKPFAKGEAYILDVQQMRDTTADERKWAELIYAHIADKKIDLTDNDIPVEEIVDEGNH